MFLPAGYVKLEGATVNRSNYPRLVALADEYSLWTSDTTANPGLFGEGDGSTTMTLPNWTGRMAQFASTAGGKVNAGLPNITGSIGQYDNINNSGPSKNGAFDYTSSGRSSVDVAGGNSGDYITTITFAASSSNSIYGNATTVQPPAVKAFAIMRY